MKFLYKITNKLTAAILALLGTLGLWWGMGYPPFGVVVAATEEALIQQISSLEANYLAKNGAYFQMLPTHYIVPSATTTPDALARKPTDRKESWNDIIIIPDVPFSVQVHQSQNGYQIMFTQKRNGFDWSRAYGIGPDFQTWDWRREQFPGDIL